MRPGDTTVSDGTIPLKGISQNSLLKEIYTPGVYNPESAPWQEQENVPGEGSSIPGLRTIINKFLEKTWQFTLHSPAYRAREVERMKKAAIEEFNTAYQQTLNSIEEITEKNSVAPLLLEDGEETLHKLKEALSNPESIPADINTHLNRILFALQSMDNFSYTIDQAEQKIQEKIQEAEKLKNKTSNDLLTRGKVAREDHQLGDENLSKYMQTLVEKFASARTQWEQNREWQKAIANELSSIVRVPWENTIDKDENAPGTSQHEFQEVPEASDKYSIQNIHREDF